jgi:hypothetical protein
MQIAGQLQTTTLGDVLGELSRGRATGSLELREPIGRLHRIVLRSGSIQRVDFDRASPTLAEILKDSSAVEEGVLRRSLLRALTSKRKHGTVLEKEFSVPRNVINLALKRQMRERLNHLERLSTAQLAFRAGGEPVSDVHLSAEEFLPGRARARDRKSSGSARPTEWLRNAEAQRKTRAALATLGLHSAQNLSLGELRSVYAACVREIHPDSALGVQPSSAISQRLETLRAAYEHLRESTKAA